MVQAPEIIVAAWREARRTIKTLTERQVREEFQNFENLWSELFPMEQARLVQLLVARVEISTTGVDITLRTEGLGSAIRDLLAASERKRDAA